MYCTAKDLIAHAHRARLISQLAGSDYGVIPPADMVLAYFNDDAVDAQYYDALDNIKARAEQAITNATADIDGYLALMPDVKSQLPVSFLHATALDMAMFRLFDNIDKDSVTAQLNARRHAFFNDILSGKTVINRDIRPDNGAQTTGEDMVFTPSQFEGY